MNYQQLLEQVQQYIQAYYKTHHEKKLLYHNSQHTEDVVGAAVQIANHYQLDDRDFFIVITAAWFHDVGYITDQPAHHEESSASLAEKFLLQHQVEPDVIDRVKKCILATKMPQSPTNLLEEIVCDADLFHFGTAGFAKKSNQMRKEFELMKNVEISKHDWRHKTIMLMEQHHYHTDYCQLLLNDEKRRNIDSLRDKEAEWEKKNAPAPVIEPKRLPQGAGKVDSGAADKKKDRPDKGIETMFRISSANHQRLSDMADNKAHIMITVNSIILSAIISLLLRRLEDYPYFIIPTFIILSISLVTLVFSILATRPSIPNGIFSKEDIDNKKVNLLFFGNFYRMSLEDYADGMTKVMADREFLYGSLIRDVYSQGVILGRKYRLLRVSYNVFMFGLVASVIAFCIASAINGKH